MSRIIRETLNRPEGGIDIQIEVEDSSPAVFEQRMDYGPTREGRFPLVERPFEKGMELIRACAEQVASVIDRIAESARPDEVEVELGVKFDGEVGALISRTGVEAHLQVTLKWSRRGAE